MCAHLHVNTATVRPICRATTSIRTTINANYSRTAVAVAMLIIFSRSSFAVESVCPNFSDIPIEVSHSNKRFNKTQKRFNLLFFYLFFYFFLEEISKCFKLNETGPCRGSFNRFFYNHRAQKCESFIYGKLNSC